MLPARPFYLLRHGESEANAAEICAGGMSDSPLNETGRGQARALAAVVESISEKPEVVFHSSMSRARETAQIVNKALKLEIEEEHHLREHEVGEWEGAPWADVAPRFERKEAPPGGETHSQFAQRIQRVITDIFAREPRLPLLVAHGGVFHALGYLYEYGMSPIQNCHLHYFEPCSDFDPFPWRVWQFDVDESGLTRASAPFCLSQTLSRIA